MDLVKKVDECEYYYIYIYIYCRTAERGYAEKETTMVEEWWWEAPGMVVLRSTKINAIFGLHWPEEPRAVRWP